MAKEEGGGGEGVAKEDAGAVQQCSPTAAGLAEGGGRNVEAVESNNDIFDIFDNFYTFYIYFIYFIYSTP